MMIFKDIHLIEQYVISHYVPIILYAGFGIHEIKHNRERKKSWSNFNTKALEIVFKENMTK